MAAFAYASSPEALAETSGIISSANFSSFLVLGENVAGGIFGGGYSGTVGLASVVFTPLVSQAGTPVPTVNTAEVDIISFPNPFNPNLPESVTIAYKMAQDVEVKVYIFDVTGVLVRTITSSSSTRRIDGLSWVYWDGRSNFGDIVENGVYLVRIVTGGKTVAKTKVMVIK